MFSLASSAPALLVRPRARTEENAMASQRAPGATRVVVSGPVVNATLASTEGSFKMAMTDPKTKKIVHDAGSYTTVYRKQDGKWMAVIDIASSSGPSPAEKK